MLIRVARSISKFPSHVVPILTSTVIECQRAKLFRSSYEYASMIMRPEYRKLVDPRYKRKIEAIVRKRSPAKEEDEKLTPCPVCSFELPETQLTCPECNSSLPYCATSGRHMLVDDWTICPDCRFPHLYSMFVNWVKTNEACSMCNKPVALSAIQKVDDPKAFLNKNKEAEEATAEGQENAVPNPATDAPAPPKKANW